MKTKIKEALQLAYKRLGLDEEVFERVATSVETFITEETLSNFVDGAESLLKHYQGVVDKARRETSDEKKRAEDLQAKLNEAEAKLKEKGDGGDGNQQEPEDIEARIKSAVEAAVQPLRTELAAFKGENAAKQALKDAKDKFFANDYAKKFTQERDDAWERAIELNEATGSKMTADELGEKAMGYFNKSVARKGVDTTKPFQAEDHSDDEPDFSAQKKRLQEKGLLPADEQ